jgi:ectoine hydroxylase-related dioxygenase (phytanoyl-CoA dioxygenase family)
MVSPASLQHKKRQLLDDGYCVVPEVLDTAQTAFVRERLSVAANEFRRRGDSTFMPVLDPNDANVRVFNLLELDPVFRDLIRHPLALGFVRHLLSEHFLISNFTANIARPGSGSMTLHSDQALVTPAPWLTPWSINVIWCLDDVYEENGATRFIPGSHRFTEPADLPPDAMQLTVPFRAHAGSCLVMDGRLWHTSGANVTDHAERALLFGYYSADFVRPQVNWNALLSGETQASLDAEMRGWLGLGPEANVRHGGELIARGAVGG